MESGGQQQSWEESALEAENERRLGQLASKVGAIRDVTRQIRSSVRESTVDVESLEADMGGARSSLAAAGRNLAQLFHVGANSHTGYIVLFLFVVFLILFFLIRHYRATH